jgi:hypothetical protein
MKKILQINFKVKVTRPQLEQAFLQGAPTYAKVKGLLWKVWLVNEAQKSGGGIYLFKDDASLEAYLKGELIAAAKKNPALSDFEVKVFDVVPEPTKITRGPID